MKLTHRVQNNIGIIDVKGEMVFSDEPDELLLYVDALLRVRTFEGIVGNLEQVTRIDSSGMAILVLIFKKLQKQQIPFGICQLNNGLEIIRFARLHEQIPIYDTEEATIAYLTEENL